MPPVCRAVEDISFSRNWAIIPILIPYDALQKHFVEDIVLSGIK